MRKLLASGVLVMAAGLAACGGNQSVLQIPVGSCLNADDLRGPEVSHVELVDCAEEHTAEAYHSQMMPPGPFPGVDAVKAEAEAACLANFEVFVGLPYEQSSLTMQFLHPIETSWEKDNGREILCIVQSAEPVTASLAGSAK